MENQAYKVNFLTNENDSVVAMQLQVMTGFQQRNHYAMLSSVSTITDLASFNSVVKANMSTQAFAAKYPTAESIQDAIDTEVLWVETVAKVIEIVTQDQNELQYLANLLSESEDTWISKFCDKYDLIPLRLRELWNMGVNEELNNELES
jgi:hypothetical protein